MERAPTCSDITTDINHSRQRFWPICILALAVAMPLVGWSGSVAAQTELSELSEDDRDKMQEFLKAGKEEYEQGNFESAVPFLKKAYEIFPKPAFHYRLALAYERAGQPKNALEYYRKFLEAKPDSDKRGQIEKTIQRLESRVNEETRAMIRVESSPSSAEVSIGDGSNETRGETPMEMYVEPGEVKLVLQKQGHGAVSESVEVEAGKSYEYNYTLPPEEAGSAGSIRKLPLAIAGLGMAGLTTYLVGEIATPCTTWPAIETTQGTCTEGQYDSHVEQNGVWLGTSLGLGVVGLGTAGVLWVMNGFRHDEAMESSASAQQTPPRVNVSLRPTGVTISGTF